LYGKLEQNPLLHREFGWAIKAFAYNALNSNNSVKGICRNVKRKLWDINGWGVMIGLDGCLVRGW
jgi:hypothetical protein